MSKKLRIAATLSVVWYLVSAFVATQDDWNSARDIALIFLVVSAPASIFWAVYWIRGASGAATIAAVEQQDPMAAASDATSRHVQSAPGYSADWTWIGPLAAKSHKLYGFGGWSVFLVVGAALGPLGASWPLYQAYTVLQASEAIQSSHPAIYNLLRFELVNAFVVLLFCIALSAFFFQKDLRYQSYYLGFTIYSLVAAVLDGAGAALAFDHYGLKLPPESVSAIGGSIGSGIGLALWCWYVQRSRRVNVTFRHRIRP